MLAKKLLIVLIVASIFLGACAPTLTQSREEYVKAHPNLDPKIKDAILQGKATVGMTLEEVKASCGEPNILSSGVEAGKYCDYWGYKRYSVTVGPEGKVIKVTPKQE
jgi:hypothetical protein